MAAAAGCWDRRVLKWQFSGAFATDPPIRDEEVLDHNHILSLGLD